VNKAEWVALSILPGVGGVTMRRLLAHFGSLPAILGATDADLCAIHGIGEKTAGVIRHISPETVRSLLDTLTRAGIDTLTWEDDHFPSNLLTLHDAPPTLFVRGELSPADETAVAIVGTRTPTPSALGLAGRGITIVSGLAMGVDTAAHHGALDAGGRTLAVLGSGIRVIHPKRNRDLVDRIVERGAILSELHPDATPTSNQLVARDRITSGLSRWVIVVESGTTGGSMRTAEFAIRQGRLLAALPGSPGADLLIEAGAEPLHWSDADWDALATRVRETDVHPPRPSEPSEQLRLLFERRAAYSQNNEAEQVATSEA